MKIKNISVICIDLNTDYSKVIFMKKASLGKRLLRFMLNDTDNEYKCIFTKTTARVSSDIYPLATFLKPEEMKKSMSKKKLRKIYKNNEETIIKQLTKRHINQIGFNK